MTLLLGIDIGGSFTDIVASDVETGEVRYAKTPTYPGNLVRSLREALEAVQAPGNEIGVLRHGTTVVINAILTRRGAKTALITTEGFRDVLEIGRTNWPEPYNLLYNRMPAFVPREFRYEIRERMGADGKVVTELDRAQLDELVERIRTDGIESVAVCLLHSYQNDEHERLIGEHLAAALPDVYVSLSSELSKEFREYERTSTVVTNAFVGTVIDEYITDLEAHLGSQDFVGTLYLMESNGGVMTAEEARRRPVSLVESGPAAGAMATAEISKLLGIEKSVAFDMGGTTAKACLVEQGEPMFTAQYFVPDYEHGYPVRVAALDIIEVGTGGGSIASVDDVGMLSVGPQSAGAVPGPACYGTGGTMPTVTDANLVLGRLNPNRFLDGGMVLDVEKSTAAIQTLVDKLGGDVATMAHGITRIANVEMAGAIARVSLERGRDPREFTLFAYGGAGALHAADLARELAIPRVIIPVMPGIFSALGMLLAELRQDFTKNFMRGLETITVEELRAEYGTMEADIAAWESHVADEAMATRILRFADVRYRGQEFTILVPVLGIDEADAVQGIRDRFETEYELRYGHAFSELAVEIVNLRAVAFVALAKPELQALRASERTDLDSEASVRPVYFDGVGFVETQIISRSSLLPGAEVQGPAVVEEYGATTVVGPQDSVTVDELGQLVLSIGMPGRSEGSNA